MGCLTAGFGMGPGVTTPLLTPETVYHQTPARLIYAIIVLFGITKFDYGNQRFAISLILTPETLGLNRLRDKLAYLFVIVHMRYYTTCFVFNLSFTLSLVLLPLTFVSTTRGARFVPDAVKLFGRGAKAHFRASTRPWKKGLP